MVLRFQTVGSRVSHPLEAVASHGRSTETLLC